MKTIKELQKTPDTNMMLEDGYILALKDVLGLIDEYGWDCRHIKKLKARING